MNLNEINILFDSKKRIHISDPYGLNLNNEICSAYWFRITNNWFKITYGYNNPLNYKNIHSELFLIQRKQDEIAGIIKNYKLSFWGIGVGDTEMQIVDIQLKKYNKSNIAAIDINPDFLNLFEHNLEQKRKESNFVIKYEKLNKLFEKVDLHKCDKKKEVHCVLGSSISNYSDTNTFFNIISSNVSKNDILFVGYQLSNNFDVLFNKYRSNIFYLQLIGNFLPESLLKKIRWVKNIKKTSVEAWLNGYQMFRSKKFQPDEVTNIANKNGYESLEYFVDDNKNICLHFLCKK